MFLGNENNDCIRGTNDYGQTDFSWVSNTNPSSIPENTTIHHEATLGSRSDDKSVCRPLTQDSDGYLSINKWNPLAGEQGAVSQAEQNIECKDTYSEETWRDFKKQRIEYSKNSYEGEQNDMGDILRHYSIRELDPEWCNSEGKNGLHRSMAVPNNCIDETNVFESNKIGLFNKISDRNLCITGKALNSNDNQNLNFINNNVAQNNVRKNSFNYAQLVPNDTEYMNINKLEKQLQPMVERKRFKPVPTSSELRFDNSFLEFSSNSLTTQLEKNNNGTKSKEEVNSAPKNFILNISSQVIPSTNSTNIIDSSFTPNVIGVQNVQSQDGLDGNLLGASSHIINFKNNVFNIPPPPISPQ